MIILDENILDGQRLLLRAWRLAAKQIGLDFGQKGLKDEEIVVLLRRQRNAAFFTRDGDFFVPVQVVEAVLSSDGMGSALRWDRRAVTR